MRGASPSVIYKKLRARFGFLDWWPGKTKFEIFVGAVLTQQTAWNNVKKAIGNLKAANRLDLDRLAHTSIKELESLIKPSGFYRQKAGRLKGLCGDIRRDYGSLDNLFRLGKNKLREVLLSYNGIGDETADSIILYAAEKPVFVVDAYTKRAMHRIDPRIRENIRYEDLKKYFEDRVNKRLELYKEMHAQFVELGKRYCKTMPICAKCPLNDICEHGMRNHA